MTDTALIDALRSATARVEVEFRALCEELEKRHGVPVTTHERKLIGTAFGRGMEFAKSERKLLDEVKQ